MPKIKRKKASKRKISARRHVAKKSKNKIVFIVVDGMADLPVGQKTPLSAASKPNMDWLAKNGACGELLLMEKNVWDKHIVAGSHLCNIALLGYNVKDAYAQRG